jgi:TRAP-type C4-dicarboxylate transport system permease small subunit
MIVIALIVLFTGYEVIIRVIFGKPTLWTNEICSYLLVWLGLLGVIYAYDKGAHVSVDLFFQHFTPKVQNICKIITAVLTMLFGTALLVYGYTYWWLGYSKGWKHFGMLDVPTSYTRIAVPICGLLLIFQVSFIIYGQIREVFSREK